MTPNSNRKQEKKANKRKKQESVIYWRREWRVDSQRQWIGTAADLFVRGPPTKADCQRRFRSICVCPLSRAGEIFQKNNKTKTTKKKNSKKKKRVDACERSRVYRQLPASNNTRRLFLSLDWQTGRRPHTQTVGRVAPHLPVRSRHTTPASQHHRREKYENISQKRKIHASTMFLVSRFPWDLCVS